MADKEANSYKLLFTYLKDDFNLSTDCFLSDFEKAIRSALQSVFPDTKHVGCWFHFGQVGIFVTFNMGYSY